MPSRRLSTILLVALPGLIALAALPVVVHFWRMPVQPAHPAMARVVAIAAHESKFGAYLDTIDVRNATGTGGFSMKFSEVHCHVGDLVPVKQQGVTLTRVAKTCR
jgi:purine nucleoside permease